MSNKWVCCCGCHVTTGAFILACLGLLSLLAAPMLFLLTSVIQRVFIGWTLVVTLITCLPIIIGQITGKRRPGIYLPYLIFCAIVIVISVISNLYVLLVRLQVIVPSDSVDELYFNTLKGKNAAAAHASEPVAIGTHIVVSILGLALNLWFFSIVYRAYKFVKEFEGNSRKNLPV